MIQLEPNLEARLTTGVEFETKTSSTHDQPRPVTRSLSQAKATTKSEATQKVKMAEKQQSSNPITLTNEQFAALLQQIQISATSVPVANIAHPQDNFSRCTSRFDGNKTSDVEAFIDAIVTYKDCTNTSNENALKGLPILLTDLAAMWWQGIKTTVDT